MVTPTPGDDPTLELPIPAPPATPAPRPADDTAPYPPNPPYPPPGALSPFPPAVAAPRPRGRGCVTALALAAASAVLLVLLAAALLAGASDSGNDERLREAADVELTDCASSAGLMASTVRITNHSSKRSNYVVDIVFESPDGARQLATRSLFVNDLGPGQVTELQAGTLAPPPGDFHCRVSQVERFSDEG